MRNRLVEPGMSGSLRASAINGRDGTAERRAVVVPVGRFDRRAVIAAQYALTIPAQIRHAIHVIDDESAADELAHGWMDSNLGLPLEMLSLQSSVACDVATFARGLLSQGCGHVVIVLGRRVPGWAWQSCLHDHAADQIVEEVRGIPGVLTSVISVGTPVPLRSRMA